MSLRGILLLCTACSLAACQIPNPGIDPQPATLNFPIALALARGPRLDDPSVMDEARWLVVVNSDFDARYNQGTMFTLDMELIAEHVRMVREYGRSIDRSGCADGGSPWSTADGGPDAGPAIPGSQATSTCFVGCTNQPAWFDPSVECQLAEVVDLMPSGGEAWIDSFVAGIARSPQPGPTRLYLATRASADLTFVDIDPGGRIVCDQGNGSLRCGDSRRHPMVSTACAGRDMTMAGDPTGVTVMRLSQADPTAPDGDTRDVVVMTMRHGGMPSNAALFIDGPDAHGARVPIRTHVLTNLPSDAINAELEPTTGLTWMSTASPIATRATRIIARIGVQYDHVHPECAQAFAAPPVVLDGIATGFESRDVAFGPDSTGNRLAYVLSRSPEGIITIDQQARPLTTIGSQIVSVDAVGFGPSRMRRATLSGREFLLTTCFDGRALWAMSTEPTQVVSVVPGFDGAYEMVIDESRSLAIVADFKTSVLRIVDLAPLVTGGDARIIGRIGTPRTHVGFP